MNFLLISILLSHFLFVVNASFISSTESLKIGDDMTPLIMFGPNAEESNSQFDFLVIDDPVMGGDSHSDFSIISDDKEAHPYLKWDGEVVDVSFLQAPGFCLVQTAHQNEIHLNDISGATMLHLRVRSNTPEYEGFTVGLASKFTPRNKYEFQTRFSFPADAGSDWQWISLPITSFTSDFFGHPAKPCNPKTGEYCAQDKDLANLDMINISADGVDGKFNLEVMGIFASTASSFMSEEFM